MLNIPNDYDDDCSNDSSEKIKKKQIQVIKVIKKGLSEDIMMIHL